MDVIDALCGSGSVESLRTTIAFLQSIPPESPAEWGATALTAMLITAMGFVWRMLRERERDARQDLATMREEQSSERGRWEAERAEFRAEIRNLAEQTHANAERLGSDMRRIADQLSRLLRYMIGSNPQIDAKTADEILRGPDPGLR